MKYSVLSTQESSEWFNSVKHLPQSDIYFYPEYHRAYELNGDGKAYAFMVENQNEILFYPFLVRPIEKINSKPVGESWYDIETVYGYSGPLCTTADTTFLREAWSVFDEWCGENRIIAEFVRFNPLMENHRYMDESCTVMLDRETIVINLNCSEEELWKNYPSVQRNMVRKALKKGLVCEDMSVTENLSSFQQLYDDTMTHVKAGEYYNFSAPYFDCLCNALGERMKLFVVRHKDRIIAAALFLLYGERIHYHLAGSDADYKKFAPNNLLLHTVAQWGQERGFRHLHLGGGRTPEPGDRLFRFKSGISKLRVPFYTGQRLHNQNVYESLCDEWVRQSGAVRRPNYFLLYRMEQQT